MFGLFRLEYKLLLLSLEEWSKTTATLISIDYLCTTSTADVISYSILLFLATYFLYIVSNRYVLSNVAAKSYHPPNNFQGQNHTLGMV